VSAPKVSAQGMGCKARQVASQVRVVWSCSAPLSNENNLFWGKNIKKRHIFQFLCENLSQKVAYIQKISIFGA
jgi:hypothetical protein